ncbi:unnamed protein product [Ectocarpus sp. 6 AP-2014]
MRDKPSRPKRNGVVQQSNASRTPLNLPKTPRKLARQPPLKGTRRETLQDIARRVPVEVLLPYFNFSLRTAADAMCISVTSLKRLCRRHGVKRWPHRQLSGLNRTVSHLEERQATSSDPDIARQLARLYCRRDEVIDLAFTSDDNSSEPERASSPSRIPDAEETRGASVDSETMLHPARPVEAYNPAHAGAPGGQGAAPAPHSCLVWANPEAMAPAGGRRGASQQWQRQQEEQLQHQEYHHYRNRGGNGASRRFGGAKAGARDAGGVEDRRTREWGDSSRWVDGGSSGSSSGSNRGFEAVRGETGFFREPSGLVRCPVEPTLPPPCYARAIAPPPPSSNGGVESPATGERLQMRPSSRGPAGGRAAATTSRVVNSKHRPWPSPTHFAPLPSPEHSTGGGVETQTTARHGAPLDPPFRRRTPPPEAGGGGDMVSRREMEWTTNSASREPPQVGTNVAGCSSVDSVYGSSAAGGGYGDGRAGRGGGGGGGGGGRAGGTAAADHCLPSRDW